MRTLDQLQDILHPLNKKNLSEEEYDSAAAEFQLQLKELGENHSEPFREKQMSETNDFGFVNQHPRK